ncbi:chromosome partitioning protein ParB [Striga asiatica]|uniref:Chromosome partitioning protein ParB n=1 Tax=Striga asiatica TaxID=4170 RepID=A0A5A7QUK8_STRAF|nr:chromosome partitioning protein ParB [Striga asiatica]
MGESLTEQCRVEVEGLSLLVNFFSRRRSNDVGNKHRLTLCQQPRQPESAYTYSSKRAPTDPSTSVTEAKRRKKLLSQPIIGFLAKQAGTKPSRYPVKGKRRFPETQPSSLRSITFSIRELDDRPLLNGKKENRSEESTLTEQAQKNRISIQQESKKEKVQKEYLTKATASSLRGSGPSYHHLIALGLAHSLPSTTRSLPLTAQEQESNSQTALLFIAELPCPLCEREGLREGNKRRVSGLSSEPPCYIRSAPIARLDHYHCQKQQQPIRHNSYTPKVIIDPQSRFLPLHSSLIVTETFQYNFDFHPPSSLIFSSFSILRSATSLRASHSHSIPKSLCRTTGTAWSFLSLLVPANWSGQVA